MPQKLKNELGEYRSVMLDSDIFDIEHEKQMDKHGKWKLRPVYKLNTKKLGSMLVMHHNEIERLNIEIKRLQKELKRLSKPFARNEQTREAMRLEEV